jgi:hypothetical protein
MAHQQTWTAPPNAPLFDPLARASFRLLSEWDVVTSVVGYLDDPREADSKLESLLGALLSGFSKHWRNPANVDAHAIADALSDGLDEFFDVEADPDVCMEVAAVLRVLFEECAAGVSTGVEHVLSRPGGEGRRQGDDEELDDDDDDDEEMADDADDVKQQDDDEDDDDGWTTVQTRSKSRGNRR